MRPNGFMYHNCIWLIWPNIVAALFLLPQISVYAPKADKQNNTIPNQAEVIEDLVCGVQVKEGAGATLSLTMFVVWGCFVGVDGKHRGVLWH